jgi:hypothetical protein
LTLKVRLLLCGRGHVQQVRLPRARLHLNLSQLQLRLRRVTLAHAPNSPWLRRNGGQLTLKVLLCGRGHVQRVRLPRAPPHLP